jgi:hypothetical protein
MGTIFLLVTKRVTISPSLYYRLVTMHVRKIDYKIKYTEETKVVILNYKNRMFQYNCD